MGRAPAPPSHEAITTARSPARVERFTGDARQVLDLAQEEARILKHNYIGTEGLVRENEGVAARILPDFDADNRDLREDVIHALSGAPPRRRQPRTVDPDELRSEPLGASGHPRQIRAARMRLKRDLATGAADLIELVLHPPPEIATAKVVEFPLAVSRSGLVRTNRVLKNARISPTKTFGGLSERHRRELVHGLRGPPESPRDAASP